MTTTKKPPISLKVGEVPAYPFVNSEFEVNIHLIDNAHGGNLKSVRLVDMHGRVLCCCFVLTILFM
jgi:hypothetical protein